MVGAGLPNQPYAWTDANVLFKWRVLLPATPAGQLTDFSGDYPDQEFTFSGDPWVELLRWEGALTHPTSITALMIVDAWLVWGGQIVTTTTLDAAGLQARISLFESGLSANNNDDMLETVPTVVSAGSTGGIKFTPANDVGMILNGQTGASNRRVIGLQVENTGGSAFTPGALGVIVRAVEI